MNALESDRDWLPVANADLSGNERSYLLEAFDSGWISGSGPFVDRFEAAMAEFCGVKHAITCANGTVALHLALLALDIGPGDEVIVPSLTYVATANAVRYCGAEPIFADCDRESWNITVATVEPLITASTKAIIPVHLYGLPVDMDPLRDLAKVHGLAIVEDAAEAQGAIYRGRPAGSFGDLATLSFYGNKIMTTGEGGMVLTSDDELAQSVRLLRGQGMDPNRRYWFPIVGYNYRLTNLQCAIGLAQLERVGLLLAARRHVDKIYRKSLEGLKHVTFQSYVQGSSCWMTSVLLQNEKARDRVAATLRTIGVETRPVFPSVHRLPPYASLSGHCPVTDEVSGRGISLPSGGHVERRDIDRIAMIIAEISNDG